MVARSSLAALVLGALLVGALAGCGSSGAGATHDLTVGLTYIPDIQFAPFYAAAKLGYYKAAGLNVTLRHHALAEDEFGAVVSGKEDAVFAAGDEILQARTKNIELVDVATVYAQYPVVLIVPADSPIQSAADLRGHSVGIPGPYGANYIGLLALLKSGGLSKSDVTIDTIGYTQVPALIGHKVDAVIGYANNEPVQLRAAGFAIRTLPVTGAQPLVSNGIAALQHTLDTRSGDIKALVAATLRGVQYVEAHPQDAVKLSATYVPGLNDAQKAANALAVLQATLPLWQTSGKPGYNDPAAWASMATFLQSQGLLSGPVDVTKAYSNSYLPA